MSPMHHYLYDKSIILSKNRRVYYVFNANVSLATKRPVSDIISTVAHSGVFGWHNIFVRKLLQSDVFTSLDQHIIN